MVVASETLEIILGKHRQLVEDFTFPSVRAWKAQHPNGRVVGYFPVYMPVEIIHAGGMLPLGLLGAGIRVPIKEADSYFPSFICSIPRTTMELALSGRLDFLDAIFFTPICDPGRTQAALWQRNVPWVVADMLFIPQNLTTRYAVEYLYGEYRRFQHLLEEISGRAVSERALKASLRLYNQQRRLLRQIYALRRESPWLLSAAESYVLTRAGTMLPVEEHIGLIEQVLALLPARECRLLDKVRVIFEGAFCEQPPLEYIEALEEACYIVDDDFGATLRWFLDDVPEDGDPLLALARAYGELMGYCSVQHHGSKAKGPEFIKKLRRAGAQAAVLSPAKMCEPGLDDQVLFSNYLKREGIPFLSLEFEEKANSFEDTRIQLETLAETLLFYS